MSTLRLWILTVGVQQSTKSLDFGQWLPVPIPDPAGARSDDSRVRDLALHREHGRHQLTSPRSVSIVGENLLEADTT